LGRALSSSIGAVRIWGILRAAMPQFLDDGPEQIKNE
jgi:hypothetical protein